MKLLMMGHLLGDFYFQTDKIAKKKKDSVAYTAFHCFIYSITMYIVLALTTGEFTKYMIPVLMIGGLHLFVDGVKCLIYKKYKLEKYKLPVFIIDQLFHIVFLWLVSCIYTIELNIGWIPGILDSFVANQDNILLVMNVFLLCGKPASVVVSLVFGLILQTIEKADAGNVVIIGCNKQENVKIGSLIGILEREIILILGLLGQFGAIGFVVAAKSLARHNQLNEPAFAEKYLIGTLLSSFIALLGVAICSLLINETTL